MSNKLVTIKESYKSESGDDIIVALKRADGSVITIMIPTQADKHEATEIYGLNFVCGGHYL